MTRATGNRGNYRSWIFEGEGSKHSFRKCLFEACESANAWIRERLNTGANSAVSRNVASMFAGERKLALQCYEKLISKINS